MPRSTGKRLMLILTAVLSLVLVSQGVLGGVGMSPASADFSKMVRNGYAERYFTVSNPTGEDTTYDVSIEGDLNSWISVEPKTFNISGVSFTVVKAIVRPPATIPNGIYHGRMLVVGRPIIPPGEQTGSQVSVASLVAADLSVEVSDAQTMQFKVENLQVPDTEECRPILVLLTARNVGNVNVTPSFQVQIKAKGSNEVLQTYEKTSDSIYPTTGSGITLSIPFSLQQFKCIPSGEYTAVITSLAGDTVMDSSQMDFKIYPRGTLTISGEISDLSVPNNITLGEVARVGVMFKNTGQIPVVAKLNAEAYQGGSLVDTISSDPSEVFTGSEQPLTLFFTPKSSGQYKLLVSAVFEEKKSNILEAALNVNWPQSYWIMLGVGAAAAAAAILFFVLRKRKS
jgi:hypothetical protein